MPVYRWQCFDCGLQFDASAPLSQRNEKKPCPECKTLSERAVPESVNGFFNKSVTGPVPQNTGISQLDAHIDRAIGTHARQGWEAHQQREVEKRRTVTESGAEAAHVSKNPDGSYRVMSSNETEVQKRALTIHHMAMRNRKTTKVPPR